MTDHVVKIRRNKQGYTTISGLSDGDLRLIRQQLWNNTWALDKGGPVADAVDRLAQSLSWFIPGDIGWAESKMMLRSGSDPHELYKEIES